MQQRIRAAVSVAVDETKAAVSSLKGVGHDEPANDDVADRFRAPPHHARLRRFFWAPSILVGLVRRLWSHKATRHRYLRAMVPQAVLTIAAAVLFTIVWDHATLDVSGDGLVDKAKHGATSLAAFIASLYGTLCVVEWIMIAIAREHHDAMTFHVAELAGAPAPDPVPSPRLRIGVVYALDQLRKRIRGGLILAATVAPLALLVVAAAFLASWALEIMTNLTASDVEPWRDRFVEAAPNIALTAAGLYWLAVFTLGKSAHAWRDRDDSLRAAGHRTEPLFMHAAHVVTARLPFLFAPIRWYVRLVRRLIGDVTRPAAAVERAPFEALGLSLTRAIAGLPGVYLLVRPLFPVVASVIIEARSPKGTT